MAQSRKDNKGRVLRKGETQRKCDGKYVYTYTDPEGRRKSIYSKDIKTLREREVRPSILFLTGIFLLKRNYGKQP